MIRDTGAAKLKTISTPATKESGRETEEEKRRDSNERRLSGKLGGKIDDDGNGDTLSVDRKLEQTRQVTEIPRPISKNGELVQVPE